MTASLVIVLDGITVQHSGELLFNSQVSEHDRHRCRDIYLASLEDFCFAFLFGSGIAVSRNLPKVGEETPGRDLLTMIPESLVLNIDGDRYPLSAGEMLRCHEDRDLLLTCIERLRFCVMTDWDVWKQFIMREASAYLGDDPSLAKSALPPDDYVFAKKTVDGKQVDYHMKDREAEDQMDASIIASLANTIRDADIGTDKATTGLQEFVRRVILTHFQIFLWYSRAASASVPEYLRLRLPYPTRSRLMPIIPPAEYDRLRSALVPHALRYALHGPVRRRDVITKLFELRGESFIEAIRGDVTLYLQHLRQDPTGATEILDKIKAATREVAKEKSQAVKAGRRLGTSNTAGSSTELRERLVPSDAYAQLVHGPTGYGAEDYENELARVFPELARR